MVQAVHARNGHHLTLKEDVLKHAVVPDTPSIYTMRGEDANGKSGSDGATSTNADAYADAYADAEVEMEMEAETDIHASPTALVALENTVGGLIMPLGDMQEIARWTRERGLALHLDGARLWEAAAAVGDRNSQTDGANHANGANGTNHINTSTSTSTSTSTKSEDDRTDPTLSALRAYASTADSVSLCLSKGLCAPVGTVLVGSRRFIRHARRIRKMFGGGVRMAGLISVPGRVALEEGFVGNVANIDLSLRPGLASSGHASSESTVPWDVKPKPGTALRATHALAARVAHTWTSLGGQLAKPTETNMVWLDLAVAGIAGEEMVDAMNAVGVNVRGGGGGRMVVHRQICGEAVERVERVLREVWGRRASTKK